MSVDVLPGLSYVVTEQDRLTDLIASLPEHGERHEQALTRLSALTLRWAHLRDLPVGTAEATRAIVADAAAYREEHPREVAHFIAQHDAAAARRAGEEEAQRRKDGVQ